MQSLFEALDVTSIINGAELRQTKVWPEILAPFCILFATNRVPGAGAGFRLISPRLEDSLNGAGGMRIDAQNAEIIPTQQLAEDSGSIKYSIQRDKGGPWNCRAHPGSGAPDTRGFLGKRRPSALPAVAICVVVGTAIQKAKAKQSNSSAR